MVALRLPVSVIWGCACSLALFSLLSHFIGREIVVPTFTKATQIDFTPKRKDTPVESKRLKKPVRPPPPLIVAGPHIIAEGPTAKPTEFHAPQLETGVVNRGGPAPIGADRDAIPLVRVPPDYPPRAITLGVEGWVKVQFNVTAIGSVRNAKVVDADPKGMFDEAALRSIARWHYNPKIEDGVGVERVGMQTIIRFTLNQNQ